MTKNEKFNELVSMLENNGIEPIDTMLLRYKINDALNDYFVGYNNVNLNQISNYAISNNCRYFVTLGTKDIKWLHVEVDRIDNCVQVHGISMCDATTPNTKLYVKLQKLAELLTANISKETIMEKLLQMEIGEFNDFMLENRYYANNKDYVAYYDPHTIAHIIDNANEDGYNVSIQINIMHDEYIYVKYDDSPYCKSCEVIGLGDINEDFMDYFNLNYIAECEFNKKLYHNK